MGEKETVLFAFGNQKGGVGKSTLSMVFMNYLHGTYREKYSCVAVDADDYQRSFLNLRIRDLKIDIYDEKGLKKADSILYDEVREKEKEYQLYHILPISSDVFKEEYIASYAGTVDFMGIDLPGSLMQPGVVDSYIPVDVLFIPMNPHSELDIDSSRGFLELYKRVDKLRAEAGLLPVEKYIVLSKINRKLAFDRAAFGEKFNLPILQNVFPDSPIFGRDSNSLLVFKKNSGDKETPFLMDEIFQIVERRHQIINA